MTARSSTGCGTDKKVLAYLTTPYRPGVPTGTLTPLLLADPELLDAPMGPKELLQLLLDPQQSWIRTTRWPHSSTFKGL